MERRKFFGILPMASVALALPTVALTKEKTEKKSVDPPLRLWRMGSMKYDIYPTDEAVQRLASILNDRNVNEPLDLIWGPALDVQVVSGDDIIDVINIGKPTPEAIADKVMEKMFKVTPEQCGDLRKKQRSDIVDAIKEACQEAIDAQNA